MLDLLISVALSLPLLHFILVKALKRFSPAPAPPTPDSLVFLSARRPDPPGAPLEPITLRSSLPFVELSVVVPAYNEQARLKTGLADALDWLEERRLRLAREKPPTETGWTPGSYEVLIVDDGSTDNTATVAVQLAVDHARRVGDHGEGEIRVIRLGRNRGKGGAVRHGILYARGERILFVDADGASHFGDLSELLAQLAAVAVERSAPDGRREAHGIAIGSRAHLVASETVVSRSWFRNFLMKGFHLYLLLLGLRDIRDTQCGFKLMTRASARALVEGLHVEGWIFDVELLLRAQLCQPAVPIVEVPIRWTEVSGSKLSIIRDSITMALELFIIRLNYSLGVWDTPLASSGHSKAQ